MYKQYQYFPVVQVPKIPVINQFSRLDESNTLLKLKSLYAFQDPKVSQFLSNHPAIMDVLLQALPYITKYFGDKSKVILEIFRDRESSSIIEQLFANIENDLPIDEALDHLSSLTHEWYLTLPADTRKLFNLDVL
jgi:hypothetical protein